MGLFTLYTDLLESNDVDGALIKEFDVGGGPVCLKNNYITFSIDEQSCITFEMCDNHLVHSSELNKDSSSDD